MRIIEDEVFCSACGEMVEARLGEENFSLIKKDLANYKKYKDIYVYSCPNCDFVSCDISSEEGVLYSGFKDKNAEYKNLYNYSYLNGLDKELYDFHSQEVPANLYEAYSLIAKEQKDYEKCARLIFKSIELKNIMARKYKVSKAELGGEEDNDEEYAKLDKLIKSSIDKNRKQVNEYYDMAKEKSVFFKLLYIENLANTCHLAEAKKEYLQVLKKNKLDNDLKEYFENAIAM